LLCRLASTINSNLPVDLSKISLSHFHSKKKRVEEEEEDKPVPMPKVKKSKIQQMSTTRKKIKRLKENLTMHLSPTGILNQLDDCKQQWCETKVSYSLLHYLSSKNILIYALLN